ncbi:velvet factor-domain-containing protein [Absidia repens]|uniref:Velvet factor-domain-containing protein n=1 Tax=Absidia repens TaxID=90262 RepID=A0A1X2I476_9FUNG|nr:velvet factor-domain-containing protein [Absidia repens]
MTQKHHHHHQTPYSSYMLMHEQTYPDFTYDNTLMSESSLTPLPEAGYVRQQEDVFNELISLANHRQHHQQHHHHPLPQPHIASSSNFSYSNNPPLPTTPAPAAPPPIMITSANPASSSSSSLQANAWDHPTQERQYELIVVQQPYRARMCGFGDKDRRPISPPPILQMVTRTKDGQVIKPEAIDVSFFIVVCDSWHEDGTTEANLVYHSFSSPQPQQQSSTATPSLSGSPAGGGPNEEITKTLQMRNLVGSSVASAAKLYDLDGNLGIFYVFQDISFRTEGKFKLAFSLINIGTPCGNTVNTSSPTQVLTRVYTDLFTVFTAKKFPGVVRSTTLSQCFAKQGVKIPIRKDTQVKRKKSTKQAFSAFANNFGGPSGSNYSGTGDNDHDYDESNDGDRIEQH